MALANNQISFLTDMTQEYKTKIGSQKAKITKLKKKVADLKARPASGKMEETVQMR